MYTSFYTYLLVLGGQTAGPNWLTFLKLIHGHWPGTIS